jgi:hypothetical protein
MSSKDNGRHGAVQDTGPTSCHNNAMEGYLLHCFIVLRSKAPYDSH